ncbi:creatinine amidohydrolase [Halogranum rubrum]|uniref:Creatinine amidohydrolase n=1 Tax=Halogranum rubrum TaxID=553466 RepID=A0A1I4JQG8_9EURY|nr:creatininase family protein [Halogranum rubrum]SFL68356.1 creatinine amidohydrolase [Halogranum rubrum]
MTVELDYEEYDLGNLTWEEADVAIDEADFMVLPTGAIEQHSLHLPVSVDTLRAENLSRVLVQAATDRDLSMIRLPTLPFGYSEHHMTRSGTLTLMPDTYQKVVEELGASVAQHGAKRLLIVNCHGGNNAPLKLAGDRLQRDHNIEVYLVNWTSFAREQLETRFGPDWSHAGEHETSVTELYHPDLVRTEKKEKQQRKAKFNVRQYTWYTDLAVQGGRGDPRKSDPEFMEEVVADTTDRILDALEEDLAQPVDGVHTLEQAPNSN